MVSTKDGRKVKSGLIMSAAKSAIFGIVITMILLLGISALIIAGVLTMDMADEYVICSVIIGSAIAGWLCAKKMDGGVIKAGLTTAGMYLVIILIGTIFTQKSGEDGSIVLKVIIATISGGCFGGVLRLYRKTKKSKIRKKI